MIETEKKVEVEEEIFSVEKTLKEIIETQKEILKTNREISESAKYVKNHFRFELIVSIIKWLFIVAIIVFGVVSVGTLLAAVKSGGGLGLSGLSQMFGVGN